LAEDREGSGNGNSEDGEDDDDDDDDDDEGVRPVYRLLEWGHDVIPDTIEHMGFSTEGDGLFPGSSFGFGCDADLVRLV
jgi:hypothetical protein